MKKIYFFILTLLCGTLFAENKEAKVEKFDEGKAILEARKKGIPEGDIKGFVIAEYAKHEAKNYKQPEKDFLKPHTIVDLNTNKIYQTLQTSQCGNSDFNLQNYSNWTGEISNTNTNGVLFPINTYTPGLGMNGNNGTPILMNQDPCNAGTVPNDRHCIINIPIGTMTNTATTGFSNGYDPTCQNPMTSYFDLPMTPSNGVNSIRLGSAYPQYTGQKLTYAFVVNNSNALFTYQYAAVIADGGHGVGEQPGFSFQLRDASGNPIGGPCGTFNVDATAASTDTTYIKTIATCGTIVNPQYYRKWHSVTLDLSAWIGGMVYAEFETYDCIYSGHYAYAYISASCGNLNATVSGFCGGIGAGVITAPPGFAAYQWFGPPNGTIPISGATSNSYSVTGANFGDVYSVDCITLQGCTTKINITVQQAPLQIQYSGSSSGIVTGNGAVTVCPGDSLILSGVGASTYTWTGGISDGTVFYPSSSQTYSVTDNCGDVGTMYVIVQACNFGVNQLKNNSPVEIYPNPSAGSFAVNCSKNIDEIKITDILGNIIYSAKPNVQKVNLQIEEAGIYFISITNGKENTVRKVIVNR